jgi:hypothetical protein
MDHQSRQTTTLRGPPSAANNLPTVRRELTRGEWPSDGILGKHHDQPMPVESDWCRLALLAALRLVAKQRLVCSRGPEP